MTDVVTDWWIRIAATLTAVADRAGELAERVAEDWRDDHGRERAHRLAALRRDLDEQAAAAQWIVDRAGEPDDGRETLGILLPSLMRPGRSADRQDGVRLPGIEVERVHDEPGVRLPGS